MGRTTLRWFCLCLSTTRLLSFRLALRTPLTTAAIFRHLRSAKRAMSTSPEAVSFSVGQGDIAGENRDGALNDSMEWTSWRRRLEVSNTRSRKIRGSNYVQLATVDPKSSEPRCRSVVFRGFLSLPIDHSCMKTCENLSCVMKMCTDRRSEKVKQVVALPTTELLWWFPKTSEQYRIRGELLFVGGGDFDRDNDIDLTRARKELWGNLSDAARESFLTKQSPGQVFAKEETNVPTGGRDHDGKLLLPPDDFLLMLLLPIHCDYLRLTNAYRQVDQTVDGEWQSQRLNP